MSHGTEDGTRRRGVRDWPISQLPARLLAPILLVELTAVLLVVVSMLDRPAPTRDDVVALAVLGGLGLAHTELSRNVERVRWRLTGDLHVDLTSVWVFAAAVAMAAGYAALLAAVVHTYLWLRSARTRAPLHRQVFSTATIVLSCLAAAAIIRYVRGVPLFGGPAGMLAAVMLGMLVFITVNSALVAGAIAVSTAGGTAVRELLGEWDENLVEIAALALGGMVATVLSINGWLVPFVLPPLLVLQRAALVRRLEEAANIDAKTGLLTAAAWHARAEAELGRIHPPAPPQAVLVLDLDHFKAVNDRHGHLAGDRVLAAVADALRIEVRERDLVGRFGGEEFVVLLNGHAGQTLADLESVAERVRQRIGQLHVEIPTPDGPLTIAGVTVSVGGALRTEQVDLTSLLQIADAALYAAKRAAATRSWVGSTRTPSTPTPPGPARCALAARRLTARRGEGEPQKYADRGCADPGPRTTPTSRIRTARATMAPDCSIRAGCSAAPARRSNASGPEFPKLTGSASSGQLAGADPVQDGEPIRLRSLGPSQQRSNGRSRLPADLQKCPSLGVSARTDLPKLSVIAWRYGSPMATAGSPPRGRASELATVEALLAQAVAGLGGVVLFEGGPGQGKTRLVEEAMALAAGDGFRTAYGRADVDDQVRPLGLVMSVLSSGDRPLLHPGHPLVQASLGVRHWALLQVQEVPEQAALERPLLICLDDLQGRHRDLGGVAPAVTTDRGSPDRLDRRLPAR